MAIIIDNVNSTLKNDLERTIKKHEKISIAAGCFSMYAWQELKKRLDEISELRFIFTEPTFIAEKTPAALREFYIPRRDRERSLYGTEFEIKLRNELTQKAIAKECADWIRKKATFKSNATQTRMPGFMIAGETVYAPFNGFTTVDLGCERGNNAFSLIAKLDSPENTRPYRQTFDALWNDPTRLQDVTSVIIDAMSAAYRENSPEFIYFYALYNLFSEFLDDISNVDSLPDEATGFKQSQIWNLLYNFQKDAALGVISKLEKYNGCILADSVGLGKTFTALAVIKYYENRNKSVLVLCPKKLSVNWETYKSNYKNNPIATDRLRYDVLYHTDLSRDRGRSNGIDLERLNWGNYDLLVIDESHNFRNGGSTTEEKENRYLRLMNRVIRAGVRTKVLMLSATPVNNRFADLRNQLALAYEGDPDQIDAKLDTGKPIDQIFNAAQRAYNEWGQLPAEERSTQSLLNRLDFDFFKLLDSVTIARSRKHIQKYYDTAAIGRFPVRLKPVSRRPGLTDLTGIAYEEIYKRLELLNLAVYIPSNYIHPSQREKYAQLYQEKNEGLSQLGREKGIRRLMAINLLKRLESSVNSFHMTLSKIMDVIGEQIVAVQRFQESGGCGARRLFEASPAGGLDADDENTDYFTAGRTVQIDLGDMDYISWSRDMESDLVILRDLAAMTKKITPEHDLKLQALFAQIDEKMACPINPGNRKILIFTAFADTADYLYDQVSEYVRGTYGLYAAEITGSTEGRSNLPGLRADLNHALSCFSPRSKERDLLMPDSPGDIDVLIATDCISEGQNLQDCDYVINYDIHWNPVRIIQRFGRVDRIGSRNDRVQLVNFWPDLNLDEYINLKARVEARMRLTVMSSTGDSADDPVNDEKQDLEYRSRQLKRLQEEVVDIEDMQSGVSIMDLGLNEFRLDLLEYMKSNSGIENAPHGLHALAAAQDGLPAGVVFVLRNVNESVNAGRRNQLHPFYMVYIAADSRVVCDYLNPQRLLDAMRLLCKGRSQPNRKLCAQFNAQTDDGRKMDSISKLLNDAIQSVIQIKEENDIDSLFAAGGTSALESEISGLDDFELVCFLVIRNSE
ncbi:helicase-related protein [uncultured Pyramidobacter sp.]|uniref:helicase-related protein n=1 Tax=uncultured Pyramidobacter sp. TaxID=1623495 RepID=UPI00258466B4|nr:helicase-related protein [uncultured Pyramidobacter sp.]